MTALLRLPEVIRQTGLSRSTIYARIREGRFPKPVPIGAPQVVGWIDFEVEQYVRDQVMAARPGAA